MIIGSEGSLVHSEVSETPAAPPDERFEAFSDFIKAIDSRDWRAGQLATRRLRALGYSVCLVRPSGQRGSR